MGVIGNRTFDLLAKISYERLGGSTEELNALNILKKELDTLKIANEIEEFEVDHYSIKKAECIVTEPNLEIYNVTGYGMSGNIDIEKEFVFLENPKYAKLLDLEDKIVLVTGGMPYTIYEDLVKAKVAAFITTSGSIYDDVNTTDLEQRQLRSRHYNNGKIPGVTMRISDAEKLILSNPKKIKIIIEQEEGKRTSHNLVATIPGTVNPEEIICFTAHYDSVKFSTGAYDNGTGSVTIMEVLRYFHENKPNRTLKFIWCGSEEMGLLGSHDYVNKHESELDKYKLCINVDMTGVPLGRDIAVSTAEMSLVQFIDYFAKIKGFIIDSSQGVYSSDSTPFANKNVPAVSFARISSRGGAEIHSRKDVLDLIKPEYLEKTIIFIQDFSQELINSKYFPIPKTMPQNMKDDLDKYLGVKKNG